jgi:hypothetical protein
MSLTEADAAPRAAVPDPVRRSLVTALHDLDADLFAASAGPGRGRRPGGPRRPP